MFSALAGEKGLLRPFVFKKFSALGAGAAGGRKVAVEFPSFRLESCGIINTCLLCLRGAEPPTRTRCSARVFACRATAWPHRRRPAHRNSSLFPLSCQVKFYGLRAGSAGDPPTASDPCRRGPVLRSAALPYLRGTNRGPAEQVRRTIIAGSSRRSAMG